MDELRTLFCDAFKFFHQSLVLTRIKIMLAATEETVLCLFRCFKSQVNSYGHGGTVSSPNHAFFFLGKLEKAINQYFVHILSLVTDNNPS